MRRVKKTNIHIRAFELGNGDALEEELIKQGLLIKHDGFYEVHSLEALKKGEKAYPGDYVKIDQSGSPYPNARQRFIDYHIQIEGHIYSQKPLELYSWTYDQKKDDVIEYLLEKEKLKINIDSFDNYYQADIWGTTLSAKKTDIILIYDVIRDGSQIVKVDFNLIDRDEFEKTYEYLD